MAIEMEPNAAVQPAYYGLLTQGSFGPDTAQLQTWLNGLRERGMNLPHLTVDGRFGRTTGEAVRAFQALAGLTVDGKAGRNTWDAVYRAYAAAYGPGLVWPGITMRSGMLGGTVRAVQQLLNEKDGARLNADGHYGSATKRAVELFQHCQRIEMDGVVGRDTWTRLYGA